ncbi:MAG: TatD family hydrolase [Chloroflexi bacterium]|nr:TatD family hydrolase [Chloroflexota bacterium]
MFYVDTHCHLNIEVFNQDIDDVIKRAIDVGVIDFVIPGFDVNSCISALEISSRFNNVFVAIGIHPNHVSDFEINQISRLEDLMSSSKVVAIGEIGLDYYRHPETKNQQIDLLHIMLDFAAHHNKPLILHCRESLEDLLAIIQHWISQDLHPRELVGVFHAFEGTIEQAMIIQKMGFFIGVGGAISYPNRLSKQSIIKSVGLDRVVLETDSPYLSPHPFRGIRNEPSRIPLIAEKIAGLIDESLEFVSKKTSLNAKLLFQLEPIN